MAKAILTRGMQASGKSTWSKKFCTDNPNWVRISRDDLRHMRGKYWMPKHEPIITDWEYTMIDLALKRGYSVVVDEMNLNPKTMEKLREFFTSRGLTDIQVMDFTDVPLEVCIERDMNRPFSIGEKVLRDTYKKYLDKTVQEVYNPSPTLPKAIICDLDGTLALFDGNPYERDFMADKLNTVVAGMIQKYRQTHTIIILSGRNGKFEEVTREWLRVNQVLYDYIWMRKSDDVRKDSVVKRELFEEACRGKYNVEFVIDDRNQVVELWRSMGLICLQVADGDF